MPTERTLSIIKPDATAVPGIKEEYEKGVKR